MKTSTSAVPQPEPKNVCPNCGYCPHCGRANTYPASWYPYRPYIANPFWYTTTTPTPSTRAGNSTTLGSGSITVSY